MNSFFNNMKEGGGIPQRYKNMGFTHVGQKKQGDGQHKWKVLAKKGSQYKVVQGGYRGMQDYSQHHSKKRQSNFWSRMGGKSSSKAKDPFSPLYWHKRLGKWEDGGEAYDMNQMQTGGMMFREVAGGDISIPNLSKLQVGGYFPRFMKEGGLPKYQVEGWVKKAADEGGRCGKFGRAYMGGDCGNERAGREAAPVSGYDYLADLSNDAWFDSDKLKEIKRSRPEGVDKQMWNAINAEARRLNNSYTNPRVWGDNVDPATGRLNSMYLLPENRNKVNIPTYYQYYENTPLRNNKSINADNIYQYYKGQPGGLESFKALINSNYMPQKKTGGQMIRRADGSYSQRGLWDNIRENKGSGKKPTKQMLEQERKIKAKEMKNGGTNNKGFKSLPGYVQEKILSRMGDGGYTGTFSGNAYYQNGGEPNGSMALGQMSSVVNKLSKLREFVGEQDNLDPWIASKLAVMDHSADAISDYLMYNPENTKGGQQQEMMQMGGAQGGGQQEQIMQVVQAYAQIAQVDPKQIIQKLQSLPPEQQQKAVQQMVQAVQQAQQGSGQEQPMMRMGGGAPCYKCGGSYQYGGMTNEMGGSVLPAMPSDVYNLPSYNRGGDYYGYMDPAWMKAGGIHINPANKGKFTASAKHAGMGVQQFASHVLANKEDYSSTQVKRANFARNAAKWKKQDGGSMDMDQTYDLTNEQIQNLINQGYEIQYV